MEVSNISTFKSPVKNNMEENLEDTMKEMGQYAAAKRSIMATYSKKAKEVQAQQSSLDILQARKTDRDRVKTERDNAARAKKVAEKELAKLHFLGVCEVQAARTSLVEFLTQVDVADQSGAEAVVSGAVAQLDRALEVLVARPSQEAQHASQADTQPETLIPRDPAKTIHQLHRELEAAAATEQKLMEAEEELKLLQEKELEKKEVEEEEEQLKHGETAEADPPTPVPPVSTPEIAAAITSPVVGQKREEGRLREAREELLAARAVIRQRDSLIKDLNTKMDQMQLQMDIAHANAIKIGELVFQEDPNVDKPHKKHEEEEHEVEDEEDHHDVIDAEIKNTKESKVLPKSHKMAKQDLTQPGKVSETKDEGGKEAHRVEDIAVEEKGKCEKKSKVDEFFGDDEDVSMSSLLNFAVSNLASTVSEGSKVVSQVVRAASPARWRPLESVGDSMMSFAGMRRNSRSSNEPIAPPPVVLNNAPSTIPPDPRAPLTKSSSTSSRDSSDPSFLANTVPMRAPPELFRGASRTSGTAKFRDVSRGLPVNGTQGLSATISSKFPKKGVQKEADD